MSKNDSQEKWRELNNSLQYKWYQGPTPLLVSVNKSNIIQLQYILIFLIVL